MDESERSMSHLLKLRLDWAWVLRELLLNCVSWRQKLSSDVEIIHCDIRPLVTDCPSFLSTDETWSS